MTRSTEAADNLRARGYPSSLPGVRRCPHCNQPWPVPDTCECGDGKAVHNLSKDGKRRLECSVFTAKGPCGCTVYTPEADAP